MIFNMNRLKPDKKNPLDVLIDRTTIYGNPYTISKLRSRETAIDLYEVYARKRLDTDPRFREGVKSLKGKRLFCWCAPQPCHGEVLKRICEELNK
jgi:hypothetical protein